MFIWQGAVNSFWEFNIGHLIDAGLFVIAAGGYVISRKSDIRQAIERRDEEMKKQIEMHTENRERLDTLANFHESQLELNEKRDEQISLLRENASSLKHIVEGQDRRLQLLENSRGRTH